MIQVAMAQDTMSEEEYLSEEQQHINTLFASLQEQETAMRDEDYTLVELGEYQFTYLQLVFFAKSHANSADGFGPNVRSTNEDLTLLVDMGILPAWPANPLNDWQPVVVRTEANELLPGDLYMELCPASHASSIGTGPESVSFNMYVIGTDDVLGAMGEFYCYAENKEWASKPAEAVYGLSYYMVSDHQLEETRQKVAAMESEE
ncbi:MAG: hypothetical protein R3F46_03245 [bacterium]